MQEAKPMSPEASGTSNRPHLNSLAFGVLGGMIGSMFSFTQARFPDLMELFGVYSSNTPRRISPTLGCLFISELIIGVLVGGIVGSIIWRDDKRRPNIRQDRIATRIIAFLCAIVLAAFACGGFVNPVVQVVRE
jgi:hypothetical protein